MTNDRKSIYLETTIPSYATARESKDSLVAARQKATKLFWRRERGNYDFFVSQTVVAECELGDPQAARKRLKFISDLERLPEPAGLVALANEYQKVLGIPEHAKNDCYHLAYCVLIKIDYLATWNCAHLGTEAQKILDAYNRQHGLRTPRLVTPEFFLTMRKGENDLLS
jgi:predicted nucleic acid-binding protein